QACHACIEIARSLSPAADHPHLVLCGVKSESELRQILSRLESLGFLCKPFFEPDRAGQLTALATGPLRGDQRRRLRRYQCLPGDTAQPGDSLSNDKSQTLH